MTCGFDRELVALFAGGDLTEPEAVDVQVHLDQCEVCRSLSEQHREGILLLSNSAADALFSAPERLQRGWRWKAWAVAAALLLVLVSAGMKGSVLAGWFRSITIGEVKELSPDEVQEFIDAHQDRWNARPDPDPDEEISHDEGWVDPNRSRAVTLEEALRWTSDWLREPAYVPNGYPLNGVWVSGDPPYEVSLTYGDLDGGINVNQLGPMAQMLWRVPQGAGQTVKILDGEGLVIRGSWIIHPEGSLRWDPDFGTKLVFELDGQGFQISGWGGWEEEHAPLPIEELIKVAESLQ